MSENNKTIFECIDDVRNSFKKLFLLLCAEFKVEYFIIRLNNWLNKN